MANNDNVSLVLSRLLDSLGLDEDTRQRRMDRQKMQQLLWSWEHECIIGVTSVQLSGSSYETTTIADLSSDVDRIYIPRHIRVIDSKQQWTPGTDVRTYLMDNTACYPSFVKLYRMSPDHPRLLYNDMGSDNLPDHVVDEDGRILYSNTANRDYMQNNSPAKLELHGPAVTSNAGIDVDHVITLMCKSFPKEAEHWKSRQTRETKARIGGVIVDQALNCYLVGIGNKGSPTENIEWRLSFTHIEKQLVHAWNNVQYKCYVMIKFIHKDLVNPNVPDCILSSYHYKTTLMWMVEEYPAEFFIDSNLDKCILAVLNNLAKCVKSTSLPHYFVQGCNLFHNKFNEGSSKETAAIIETIITTWPDCLCDIKRRRLGNALRISLLQRGSLDTMCKKNLECRGEIFFQFDLVAEAKLIVAKHKTLQVHTSGKQHIEVFKLLQKLEQYSKHTNFHYTIENKHFVTFMINDIVCGVGLQLLHQSDTMANKQALRNKRLGFGCIQKCIIDCCYDTHLQIAEYFTRVGNYERALLLLDNIESRIRHYTDYCCIHPYCQKAMPTSHIKTTLDNKPSMKEYCKYFSAAPVTYTQDNLPYVPKILVYEMFRTTEVSPPVSDSVMYSWYNHSVIHCPVYLYYLRFLCFHTMERSHHRQVALLNMSLQSRRLETWPGSHIETNHNVLGRCYETLGQLHRAYREYKTSLLKQRYYNAAIWHLALLVRRKIHSTASK